MRTLNKVKVWFARRAYDLVMSPYYLVTYGFSVIPLIGTLISGWLVYLWGRFVLIDFVPVASELKYETLIHLFLQGIELLLLIPLPIIISVIVYKSLGQITMLPRDETKDASMSKTETGTASKGEDETGTVANSVKIKDLRSAMYISLEEVESALAISKKLILGILVAVAGTRMLDLFLEDKAHIEVFACGAILIGAITIFLFIAHQGANNKPDNH